MVLAGDSAGGNLALVLTQALKEAGRRLPGKLVLCSPWTDMSCSGDSYEAHKEDDPVLTRAYLEAVRQAYAPQGGWDQPELSPLFQDVSGFPPVLVQYGGHEILADDAIRLKSIWTKQASQCPSVLARDVARVSNVPAAQSQQAMERVAAFVLDY